VEKLEIQVLLLIKSQAKRLANELYEARLELERQKAQERQTTAGDISGLRALHDTEDHFLLEAKRALDTQQPAALPRLIGTLMVRTMLVGTLTRLKVELIVVIGRGRLTRWQIKSWSCCCRKVRSS
jgi:hypothetical protein